MHIPLKVPVERVLDDAVEVLIGDKTITLPMSCIAGKPVLGSEIALVGVSTGDKLSEADALARAMLNELLGHESPSI